MPLVRQCLRRTLLLFSVPLILTAFIILLGTARAESPDSIDAVVPALPDSVSIDNKVIYLDFWASWCPPCRVSFPWMQQLRDRYQDRGFEIVAVNVDHDQAAAKEFLTGVETTFPIVYDSAGTLAKQFELQAMPTSFLFSRDGALVTSHVGFRPGDTLLLDSMVRSLLTEEVAE